MNITKRDIKEIIDIYINEEVIDPCHKNGSCLYSLPVICSAQEHRIKIAVEKCMDELLALLDSKSFKLEYCYECVQGTYHIDKKCHKCGATSPH